MADQDATKDLHVLIIGAGEQCSGSFCIRAFLTTSQVLLV